MITAAATIACTGRPQPRAAGKGWAAGRCKQSRERERESEKEQKKGGGGGTALEQIDRTNDYPVIY